MDSKGRQKTILEATKNYVKNVLEKEGSGHDWWHIYRVRKLAMHLQKSEGGNSFIVEMAALLHDLNDWKIWDENQDNRTKLWLEKSTATNEESKKILEIIEEVSFKGAGVNTPAKSIEAKIVQDADRLDAIGAIGIARTFAYGGNKGRLIYDPSVMPKMHNSFEDYKRSTAPTINHFYEKLLLLKDRLNTNSARKMAESRHRFMEDFLEQFFLEWNVKI